MFRLNKQALLGPASKSSTLAKVAGPGNLQARIFRLLHLQARIFCLLHTNSSLVLGTFSAKNWSQSGLLHKAKLFSSFLYCIQNTKFRGRAFESST